MDVGARYPRHPDEGRPTRAWVPAQVSSFEVSRSGRSGAPIGFAGFLTRLVAPQCCSYSDITTMSQGQHLPVSNGNPSQRSIRPHIHYTPAPPSSRSQVIHHGSYINIDGIPAMRDDNSVWRMLGEPTKDSIEKRKSRLVIAAFRMPPIEEENEHGGASKTIPKRRSGKVSNSIPDAACWSKVMIPDRQ
jgi:hypothetical protein